MNIPRVRLPQNYFYGWTLVGVAAFVMVIGTVPLFQGMTAWFVVLEREFAWSRTQLSIAFSLSRVEGSIMGPISGYLIDKLGSRRMVIIGLVIAGGGFVIMSQMQNIWHFYAAFIVMSMGVGLGTWMPMMTVLNNWFVRNRSTAMALAMEGFLVGGMILVPLLAFAIDPDAVGRPGWRNTALAVGLFLIVVAFPVSRLVRNAPELYGQFPDGEAMARPRQTASAPAAASSEEEQDYTWQEAVRTKAFWLITMGHACSSIVIVTITVHLGPMLDDRGFSLQTVGWVVGAYTGVAAIFTLIGGYVGDRLPIRLGLFGFSAIQSVSVFILIVADTAPMVFLFAVMMGIGFGGRNPLTTAIRGAYFGRRAFASITGMSMIPMNVMLLGAPLFAGIMFDRTQSYAVPMVVVATVSLVGSTLFLLLGSPEATAETRRRRLAAAAQSSQAD
jgi:MFS family permease